MITIEGLSPKQHIIADALWECQSNEEMLYILAAFPIKEVIAVKEMMIAAALDQITDVSEVAAYLKNL